MLSMILLTGPVVSQSLIIVAFFNPLKVNKILSVDKVELSYVSHYRVRYQANSDGLVTEDCCL